MPDLTSRYFPLTYDEVKTICAALNLYRVLQQGMRVTEIRVESVEDELLAAENASRAAKLLERLTA